MHTVPGRLVKGHRYVVSVTPTFESGAVVTQYWLADGIPGRCCQPSSSGPEGALILTQGPQMPGTITFTWTPAIVGDRVLELSYFAKAPQDKYERDGYDGIYLGHFHVAPA